MSPTRHSERSEGVQITASPYLGDIDFVQLDNHKHGADVLDMVSVADVLRNAFVYPPHSIYRDVKLAASGFDPRLDLFDRADYRFEYASTSNREAAEVADEAHYVDTYHRLLCHAMARSCKRITRPWLLQSGGKDSTSLVIAAAESRPDTQCLTYLGGHEEDEVASARAVAGKFGLRHESLVCKPGRAYDRYLALVSRMPLLTADFALLSYVDLATEVAAAGGDGIIDGVGSDTYFGAPAAPRHRLLSLLARQLKLPRAIFRTPAVHRNFKLSFALATLQMNPFERMFPGSRFSDAEVDELLGHPLAALSRRRLEAFRRAITAAPTLHEKRAMSVAIADAGASFAKGLYTTHALGLRIAYPFCDAPLSSWVCRNVPMACRMDLKTGVNKVLVRKHIAKHFDGLPYVAGKGSFRFDLVGFARERFDQVHDFAQQTRELMPGAPAWLEAHRRQLDNKYHASKFYLLAITLPWLQSRLEHA